MLGNRKSKLFQFLNQNVHCCVSETRTLEGKFLSFDRHMNIVLSGTTEHRTKIREDEDGDLCEIATQRPLGLVFVRGETVMQVLASKPKKKKIKKKGIETIKAADSAAEDSSP